MSFPASLARGVRLTLTAGDGVFDWSIYDLDLLTPAGADLLAEPGFGLARLP